MVINYFLFFWKKLNHFSWFNGEQKWNESIPMKIFKTKGLKLSPIGSFFIF